MNIDTRQTPHQEVNLPRLGLSFGKLAHWLRLDEVVRRGWSARLPCVLGASVLLLVLLSGIGIPAKDLYDVLPTVLAGVPVTLIITKVT